MKYLNTYKIFESSKEKEDNSFGYTEQMLNVLKDMLLPIRDLGYNSYIQDNTENWVIRILTYLEKKTFTVNEDVLYDFDRIVYYLESENYSVFVKGVTVFNAKIEMGYDTFKNNYLNKGLSIKSFTNLYFVATKKEDSLFENVNYENILQDIEDILLPIKDLGYNNIKAKLVKDYEDFIFINVVDYDNKPLIFNEDIEYEIDRLNEYLIENKFKIKEVYFKKVESDGRIFNRGTRDMLNLSYFDFDYLKKTFMNEKLAYLSFEIKKIE